MDDIMGKGKMELATVDMHLRINEIDWHFLSTDFFPSIYDFFLSSPIFEISADQKKTKAQNLTDMKQDKCF